MYYPNKKMVAFKQYDFEMKFQISMPSPQKQVEPQISFGATGTLISFVSSSY